MLRCLYDVIFIIKKTQHAWIKKILFNINLLFIILLRENLKKKKIKIHNNIFFNESFRNLNNKILLNILYNKNQIVWKKRL